MSRFRAGASPVPSNPATPAPTGGIFGPGWTSNVAIAEYASLQDNTDTVIVTKDDGTQVDFSLLSTVGSYPQTYQSPDSAPDLTLTKDSATHFTLKDLSPATYGFTNPTGSGSVFSTSEVTNAAGQTASTKFDPTTGRPLYEYGPTPSGLFSAHTPAYTCASPPSGVDPLTTAGCQTLQFNYATTTQSTTLCPSPLQDTSGQVISITYTAWDPDKSGGAGMSSVDVADYCYGNGGGRIKSEWDPRISPALKTLYTYNTDHEVATLTPPGTNAWNFTYAPIGSEPAGTGRLATVYRAQISPLGNATTTYVYGIPLTTTGVSGGACNMTPSGGASGPCR